jgi:formate dehydrogenase subunit delta
MHAQDIIRMANQIAGFFAPYPHEEAVKETAEHLKKFWEPRMLAELKKVVADPKSGLSAVAMEAAKKVTA